MQVFCYVDGFTSDFCPPKMSADIRVVHDDLGWKNQTTRYKCWFSAASMDLQVIFVHRKRPPIYMSCMTISGGRTEHDVVMAFGELAAVD